MNRIMMTLITAASLTFAASAQTAPKKETKIDQRKDNQQKRIAQGVASGSLTPKETAHLEHKEVKLNKEVRADRKANGGNLTNNQKAQINKQQNKLSKSIYNDKHNTATQK